MSERNQEKITPEEFEKFMEETNEIVETTPQDARGCFSPLYWIRDIRGNWRHTWRNWRQKRMLEQYVRDQEEQFQRENPENF